MKRFLLSTVLFFFFLTALAQHNGMVTIAGHIDTIPGSTFLISYGMGDVYIEDTITIDSEKKFDYKVASKDPLYLYVSLENKPGKPWYDSTLVGSFTVYSFWAEPNKTTYFTGMKNKVQKVENSAIEVEEQRFEKLLDQAVVGLNRNDRLRVIDSINLEYLSKSPSYYTLYKMYHMLRRDDPDLPLIKETYRKFPLDLKQTDRAAEIERLIFIKENTSIGKVFPDFEMDDREGLPVQLNTFRGKYVLIDFWASWCGPCRGGHPDLVRAYEEYREKGLEIISVSLDDDRSRWLNAVKEDGLTWTQVSDLKAFEGDLVNQLYIRAIPECYLIGPDGVIIEKSLRGEKLLKVLANTLNKVSEH